MRHRSRPLRDGRVDRLQILTYRVTQCDHPGVLIGIVDRELGKLRGALLDLRAARTVVVERVGGLPCEVSSPREPQSPVVAGELPQFGDDLVAMRHPVCTVLEGGDAS